ncbi:uncharacterized protein [Oscarella lobularis]|uniref:uncharacterized protein isoform X2 n=1 Tax=Oscarella lobularis TaxID=121494 RepID=UPI003313B717
MFRQSLGKGGQLTALELLPHGTKFKKTVTVEQKLKFHERPGNTCVKVRLAFFYGRGLTEETYRPMGIIDSDSDSESPLGYKKMSLGLSSSRDSYEFQSRSLCIVCRVDFADTFVTKIRLFGKPKSGALKELRLLAVASCSCEERHEEIEEREKKKGFTFSTELCDVTDMRRTATDQRIDFVLHEDEEETWSLRGTMSFMMHQFLHILDCNHPFDFKQECRLKLKEEAERSNDSLTVHLVCQREDGKNERHLILAETSSNDVAQAGHTEQSEPQLFSDSDGGPDSGLGDSLSNDGSPNDVLRENKMNPADASRDTDQSRDLAKKSDIAYRKKLLRVLGSLAVVVAALAVILYIVPTIFRSNGSTKATVAYDNQVKKASSPEEYEKYKDAVAIAITDGFTANMLETAITGVAGKHKHCKKLWDALEFQDSEDHCKESGNWAVKTLLSAFQDQFGTDFLVRRKMINACLKIRVLGRLLEKLKAEQQF